MSRRKSTFRKSIFSNDDEESGENPTLPLEHNKLDFYPTQYDEMNNNSDGFSQTEETPTLLRKSFSFESANEFTNKSSKNYGLNAPNFEEENNERKSYDNGVDPVIDPIPLLEELEIDFYLMWKNIRFVLNPFSKHSSISINELDVAGPIVICLALGFVLLLRGKVQFGYIYGVGGIGCFFIYFLLNLMCERGVSGHQVCSILGYCLIPMIFLSFFSTFNIFRKKNWSLILSSCFILWSTWSSAGMFVNSLEMKSKRLIVAYPILLLYITFGMISVF